MFNTSIKRQIRPTEEKNSAASDGARVHPGPSSGHNNKHQDYQILFNLINLINMHQTCGSNLLTPT